MLKDKAEDCQNVTVKKDLEKLTRIMSYTFRVRVAYVKKLDGSYKFEQVEKSYLWK